MSVPEAFDVHFASIYGAHKIAGRCLPTAVGLCMHVVAYVCIYFEVSAGACAGVYVSVCASSLLVSLPICTSILYLIICRPKI